MTRCWSGTDSALIFPFTRLHPQLCDYTRNSLSVTRRVKSSLNLHRVGEPLIPYKHSQKAIILKIRLINTTLHTTVTWTRIVNFREWDTCEYDADWLRRAEWPPSVCRSAEAFYCPLALGCWRPVFAPGRERHPSLWAFLLLSLSSRSRRRSKTLCDLLASWCRFA